MMYLRGAPFTWFLHLATEWFVTNILLLIIYFFVDTYYYKKEPASAITRDESNIRPIKIEGKRNFIFLVGVVLAVAFLNEQYLSFVNINPYFKFIREAVIILMVYLSMQFTPKLLRTSNNFPGIQLKKLLIFFRNFYHYGTVSVIFGV